MYLLDSKGELDMNNNKKKYTCVVRTYIIDSIEIDGLTEDYYHTYECRTRGTDSSLILGNDVIEMDYFDNEQDKEALKEYIKLLKCMGAEYREVA